MRALGPLSQPWLGGSSLGWSTGAAGAATWAQAALGPWSGRRGPPHAAFALVSGAPFSQGGSSESLLAPLPGGPDAGARLAVPLLRPSGPGCPQLPTSTCQL